MPYTNETYLPSIEELTVPELEITSAVYRAASLQMGLYCDSQCKEFMLCRNEERDPRKCINEGKEVTRCGFEFLGKVKASCTAEFNQYMQCIDYSSGEMQPKHCKKTKAVFDQCVKDNLGQDSPAIGHFSKVRAHKTSRPRPSLPPQDIPAEVPGLPGRGEYTSGTGDGMFRDIPLSGRFWEKKE